MPIELKKGARQDYKERHKVVRVELMWPHDEPLNPEADIAEVVVHLSDGSRYRGTVTTLQFIRETMDRARTDGGEVEGDYWFGDAIIMSRIEEEKLARIVEDLIDSFTFEKAFRKAQAGAIS